MNEPGAATRVGPWVAGLCALAALQIALGLLGLALASAGVVEWHSATVVRDWQRAVEVLAFAALAGYVLVVGRRDGRAVHLGALLLLIGLFFAQPPIAAVERAFEPPAASIVRALRALTIDAFLPAVAWLFVRDFPRALEQRRSARLVRAMVAACVALAIGLCTANVVRALAPGAPGWLALLDRGDPWSHYWTFVFAPLLPVVPFVLWRTRHAPRLRYVAKIQ